MAETNDSTGNNNPEAENNSLFQGVTDRDGRRTNPVSWIGTVNFAQGFQYAIVIQLFIVIFISMGVPNGPAVFWSSFLSLPWTFKPLWGPLVDRYWTKRNWTILMQFIIGVSLLVIAVGFILPSSITGLIPKDLLLGYQPFFIISVIFLTIIGFAAATHDIACDGFYMLALREKQQAFFVGFRSTAFRVALILVNGAIVLIAYSVQEGTGPQPKEFTVNVAPIVASVGDDESAESVVDEVAEPESEMVPYSTARIEGSKAVIPVKADEEAGVKKFQLNEDTEAEAKFTDRTELSVEWIEEDQELEVSLLEEKKPGIQYEGEPTEELDIIISDTEISADPESSRTVFVNITKEPEEGEIIPVTVRLKAEGNFLQRIVFSSDSKGMKKDGERLEFTADNWRDSRSVTLTAPLLREGDDAVSVTYSVASGNIPWSWAITLGVCALMYFAFVMFHLMVMPKPLEDVSAGTTTPILIPILALGVAVLIPMLYILTFKSSVEFLRPSLASFSTGSPEGSDLFGVVFTLSKWIFMIAVTVALIVFNRAVRAFLKKFFKAMSDVSEIGFYDVFASFFTKPGMVITLSFLLTFRLGEAQLAQLKTPFLIGDPATGALGMSLGNLAFVNTVFYLAPLTVGGILSGVLIGLFGLRRLIWICVAFMHIPNALYIWLAVPDSTPSDTLINFVITAEAFGYGFGFAAYLMVMIIAAQGKYKTAHYALCTGFMTLGYLIPGLWAGYLQQVTGYYHFFMLVVIFSLPGLIFIPFLPIDESFGKKKKEEETKA